MTIYKITKSRYAVKIRDPFNHLRIIHETKPYETTELGYFSEEFAYACLNYEQEMAEDLKLQHISRTLKSGYNVLSYWNGNDNLVMFSCNPINVISTLEEFQHYKLHH